MGLNWACYHDLGPIARLWKAHYLARGVPEKKAEEVAWKRAREKGRGPIMPRERL